MSASPLNSQLVRRLAMAAVATALLAPSAASHAGTAKNRIAAVDAGETAGDTTIAIRGSRTPTFTVYKLKRPSRVVIDISNAELTGSLQAGDGAASFDINSWGVSQVSAHALDGSQSVVRVVVRMARPGTYKVKASGNDVVVTVEPRDPAPARASGEADRAEAARARKDAQAARAETERERAKAREAIATAEKQVAAARAAETKARGEADKARLEASTARAAERRARDELEHARTEASDAKRAAAERERLAAQRVKEAVAMTAEAEKKLALASQTKREATEAARAAEARAEQARTVAADAEKDAREARAEAARLAEQAKAAAQSGQRDAQQLQRKADAAAAEAERQRGAAARAAKLAAARSTEAAAAEKRAGESQKAATELARQAQQARSEAEARRAKAEKMRAEAETALVAAEARRADAEKRATSAKQRATAAASALDRANGAAQKAEAEAGRLRAELDQAQASAEALRAERNQAQQEAQRLRGEKEQTEARLTRMKRQAAMSKAEIARLQAERDRTNAEVARLEKEQAELRAARLRDQQRAEAAEQRADQARAEAEQASARAEQAKAERQRAEQAAAQQTAVAQAAAEQAKAEQAKTERHRAEQAKAAQAKALAKSEDDGATVREVDYVDRGEISRVVINLDGPATPKVIAAKGNKAILEIPDTRIEAELERTLDTTRYGGPITAVSSYRDPRDPKKVRVVVDLDKPTKSVLKRKGTVYYWDFDKPARAAVEARPAPAVAARRAPTTPSVGSSTPITNQTVAQAGRKRKVYRGRKIDLDFKDADIHNLLRLLADVGGVNIVIPDEIRATVTVRLRNVPWDQALEVILQSKGLWYRREGTLIRVAARKILDAEDKSEAERLAAMARSEAPEPEIFTLNYAVANDIKGRVQPLVSPKGRIEVDKRTNSLIINDIRAHRRRIIDLISRLDTQTPQIQIEARIVEARTSFRREFGIQWGGNLAATQANGSSTGLIFPSDIAVAGAADDGQTARAGVTAVPTDFAVNMPAAIGSGSGGGLGFSFGSVGGSVNLNLRLSALEDTGSIRIVSAPRITTLNNVTANIAQGVSIPISVVSANGVQTQFVPADLKLSVTPHVSQRDCSIAMELNVSKNEADFANTGARGDPSLLRKEASTTVLVADGETSVIGGIYTRSTSWSTSKVPFFADLPVIGFLFHNKSESDERTEVLVFVTPKITNRAFLRCE